MTLLQFIGLYMAFAAYTGVIIMCCNATNARLRALEDQERDLRWREWHDRFRDGIAPDGMDRYGNEIALCNHVGRQS